MPYKKQKAIRSNKKYVIYDLMTDFGFNPIRLLVTVEHTNSTPKVFLQTLGVLLRIVTASSALCCFLSCQDRLQ